MKTIKILGILLLLSLFLATGCANQQKGFVAPPGVTFSINTSSDTTALSYNSGEEGYSEADSRGPQTYTSATNVGDKGTSIARSYADKGKRKTSSGNVFVTNVIGTSPPSGKKESFFGGEEVALGGDHQTIFGRYIINGRGNISQESKE
ncbi:hypothetical protein C4572_00045 [Candidatus Parcubacteria bacterium]|nr:MAG: hypothetical protein C4572_00045 [Candidatus Parcubacteria bacterium]